MPVQLDDTTGRHCQHRCGTGQTQPVQWCCLNSACGQLTSTQDQAKQIAQSRNCYAVANCLIDGMMLVSMRALQINQGKKQAQVRPLGGLTHGEICISYSGLKVIRRPAVAAISCLRGQFLHHGLPGKFPTIFSTCKTLTCGCKPGVYAGNSRHSS